MLDQILSSLLGEIQKISRAETVIGKEIKIGESVIVPICQVHIGFGVGGHLAADDKSPRDPKGSTAIGGGIKIDPVACVVVNAAGHAQMLSVGKGTLSTLGKAIDLVPEVLERLGLTKDKEVQLPTDDGPKPKKDS